TRSRDLHIAGAVGIDPRVDPDHLPGNAVPAGVFVLPAVTAADDAFVREVLAVRWSVHAVGAEDFPDVVPAVLSGRLAGHVRKSRSSRLKRSHKNLPTMIAQTKKTALKVRSFQRGFSAARLVEGPGSSPGVGFTGPEAHSPGRLLPPPPPHGQ